MNIAGFLKVRNEIIREGNLYRVLEELSRLCDCGVVCDDASADGTREHLYAWCKAQTQQGRPWIFLPLRREDHDFQSELEVKQRMLQVLHGMHRAQPIDWILWQDGDEIFDRTGGETFRAWLEVEGHHADIWAFHYTQLWRSASYARVDVGFDEGAFWKLWRYRADLSFDTRSGLHHPQFPQQYLIQAVQACNAGGSLDRARRAPFDILHLGNYGKNLVWKAIQYRNSGALEKASLSRHLYFRDVRTRKVDPLVLPTQVCLRTSEVPPVSYTPIETALIERMGDLKQRAGLVVVVIPTYNRGYAIDRTVESVVKQTYSNWICIVLDDGSTDDTAERMGRWQDRDPRVFYCQYGVNRGGVAMNEIGCALACDFGEFWVRLGSDDYFKPHKLELDVLALRAVPAAGACWGPYRDLHNDTDERDLRGIPLNAAAADVRGSLLSQGFAASWANIAVRTSVLREVRARHGCFVQPLDLPASEERIRNMEDWLLNTRIAYLTEFVWRAGLKDGRMIIGSFQGESYKEALKLLGNDFENILHDAIWRVGADGASQNAYGNQAAIDAKLTSQALNGPMRQFQPVPRAEPFVRVLKKGEVVL